MAPRSRAPPSSRKVLLKNSRNDTNIRLQRKVKVVTEQHVM